MPPPPWRGARETSSPPQSFGVPFVAQRFVPYDFNTPAANPDYRRYFAVTDQYLAWCRMHACANAARRQWCDDGGHRVCKNECAVRSPNQTSTCRINDATITVQPEPPRAALATPKTGGPPLSATVVSVKAAAAAVAREANRSRMVDELKRQRRIRQLEKASRAPTAPPVPATRNASSSPKRKVMRVDAVKPLAPERLLRPPSPSLANVSSPHAIFSPDNVKQWRAFLATNTA